MSGRAQDGCGNRETPKQPREQLGWHWPGGAILSVPPKSCKGRARVSSRLLHRPACLHEGNAWVPQSPNRRGLGGAWFSTCPWGALRPPAPRLSCPGWEPTRGTEAGGPRTHSSPQSGMVLSSAAAEAGVPHPQVSQEQLQSMLGTDLPRGVRQDSKTTPNCP